MFTAVRGAMILQGLGYTTAVVVVRCRYDASTFLAELRSVLASGQCDATQAVTAPAPARYDNKSITLVYLSAMTSPNHAQFRSLIARFFAAIYPKIPVGSSNRTIQCKLIRNACNFTVHSEAKPSFGSGFERRRKSQRRVKRNI